MGEGVVDHVPEPSQQTVRYWGYYANAARGKRRKAAQGGNAIQTPPSQDDDEFSRRARLTWAKLIRRVYEVDPLLCPFCGADLTDHLLAWGHEVEVHLTTGPGDATVRAAAAARITAGAEETKSGRWCSPRAKTSRPT